MNKKVVYTAIFGDYDYLEKPKYVLDGFDFVCFTDSDIKSDFWDVRKVLPLYSDPTRNARKYKILAHRYLSQYDISIWADGNQHIVGDYNKLIKSHMSDVNLACYDHNQCRLDPRDCVYDEAGYILWAGNRNLNLAPSKGLLAYKDNPGIISKQINKYQNEGYPKRNGLIVSGVILRRHNEKDVVQTMEKWWEELKYGSKRDQLSFDYSAWRTGLKFNYLHGDIRDDGYTLEVRHKKIKK